MGGAACCFQLRTPVLLDDSFLEELEMLIVLLARHISEVSYYLSSPLSHLLLMLLLLIVATRMPWHALTNLYIYMLFGVIYFKTWVSIGNACVLQVPRRTRGI